ncbi:NAD(P)-dependent oxidoreductase [Pelagibacteraceae bacterium]|nr:NAD(P)-dependent oxidoreductase [Pelagibacteraceae bacterium]
MFKIAIIEEIHKEGLNLFENNKKFKYEVINDTSERNLIKILPNYDGCSLRVSKLSSKIMSECKNLKIISRHGVGYDNIDLEYIKKNNITLTITATANATAVSEHVMYMMLVLYKAKLTYDKEVRKGSFKNNIKNIKTFELMGKEILIVGFGRIGKSLIKKCLGFDMKISVYDPFVNEETINNYGGAKVNSIDDGVAKADFISIHMPLNDKTINLINYKLMKKMKKNSIIINTARGGIINEKDLNKALNENLIFGAGLDVYEKEPPDADNPLLKNEKVVFSPHTSALTDECKIRMAKETVKNIIDFFENNIDKSVIIKL